MAVVVRGSSVWLGWQRAYRRSWRRDRGWHPRSQPEVTRRVDAPPSRVLAALGQPVAVDFGFGALRAAPFDAGDEDPVNHERRLPAELALRWSWPGLPMWLTIASYSSRTTVVGLSLRTRRRLRYPARYYRAAHEALVALTRSW